MEFKSLFPHAFSASTIKGRDGKIYRRLEFETFEALEEFFVSNILGRTDVRSKVIGKVIIFGKDK